MSASVSFLSGMKDILPDDHNYFTFIKKVIRHRCRQSGYRRITPAQIENAELYEKLLGEDHPLLKQAFHLKKEGKSGVMSFDPIINLARTFVEHNMHALPQPVELYSIEQCFRSMKIGTETFRQSLAFSVENIGENDPAIDAQVIFLAWRILKDLGILHQTELQINTIGDEASRKKYIEDLYNFYSGKEHVLGKEGMKLLQSNPLQLLNSDNEDWQILAQIAPKFDKVLTKEAREHYKTVLEYLQELGIEYKETPQLIMEENYYSHTIFQFMDISQERAVPVIRGGRQNMVIKQLGGKETPAMGFYTHFELLEDMMKRENITIKDKDMVHVFVAQLGAEAKKKCMSLLMKLRDSGIHAVGALGKGSMREQLTLAEKFKAPWAVLMGQIEVLEEIAIIRNMKIGSQEIVRFDDVIDELIHRIGEDELDKYHVGVEETIYKDGEEQPATQE